MKASLSFSMIKNVAKKEEPRIIATLLSREAIVLALFSLAMLLSMESLLPGTVSLRESMIFFILGIATILIAERYLSKTLKPESLSALSPPSSGKTRVFFWGFIAWSAFLIGNALFGFHPAIIALLLLITAPLLALFFGVAFESGKNDEKSPKNPIE